MAEQSDPGAMLYGAGQIAKYLGMPERACRYRIEAGLIPSFRLGASICATRELLDDWLKAEVAKAMAGQPGSGDRL